MNDGLFITWEQHRRALTLSSYLDIEYICLETNLPFLFRYLCLGIRSIKVLLKKRPKILFVQNPSIILSTLALLMKPIFKYKLIIDAHNIGVLWDRPGAIFFNNILKRLHKYTDLTIVSNSALAETIEQNGGHGFIMPDPLPIPPRISSLEDSKPCNKFIVTFICTFSPDEPYQSVFETSELTPNDIKIYVTGRPPKHVINKKFNSDKIFLTGFLSEIDYWKQLASSDCVMDLTTRDDCLVCGAYEALALGKPIIISDTKVNRIFFYKGAVYTRSNPENIARALINAKSQHAALKYMASELQNELYQKSHQNIERLISKVRNSTV